MARRKLEPKDLIPMGEAAKLMRVHRTTVHRKADRGEIQTVTRRCRRYVTWPSLAAYLAEHTAEENPPSEATDEGLQAPS